MFSMRPRTWGSGRVVAGLFASEVDQL